MVLSIITINYNNRDGLEKTIQSVVNQSCDDFEYIIIDGGSTDGSVDVIKKYDNRIDYWISEKDSGIYNAMNKGIDKANGLYCNFLNSGDIYHDNSVTLKFIKSNNNADICIGNANDIDVENKKSMVWKSPLNITMENLYLSTPNHQATFTKTLLLKKSNFDENYQIASDYDFFMKNLLVNECSYSKLNFIVVDYLLGGLSSSNYSIYTKERQQILQNYLPKRVIIDYERYLMSNKDVQYYVNYLSRNILTRNITLNLLLITSLPLKLYYKLKSLC